MLHGALETCIDRVLPDANSFARKGTLAIALYRAMPVLPAFSSHKFPSAMRATVARNPFPAHYLANKIDLEELVCCLGHRALLLSEMRLSRARTGTEVARSDNQRLT